MLPKRESSFGGQMSSYFPAVYKAVTLSKLSLFASTKSPFFSRYLSNK